jgi:ketol-acid reductoisomerase
MPLMKKGSTLASHGFNIVEEGMQIRKDITVIIVCSKCPGSEVREEYKRGFVPTLIAVHPSENDPENVEFCSSKSVCCCWEVIKQEF